MRKLKSILARDQRTIKVIKGIPIIKNCLGCYKYHNALKQFCYKLKTLIKGVQNAVRYAVFSSVIYEAINNFIDINILVNLKVLLIINIYYNVL